jgi:hypothetical protein
MDQLQSFESLVGGRLGSSTVSEVAARFSMAVVSDTSDGGLFFSFERHGAHVIVDMARRDAADPVVAEVRLTAPCADALPCGIRMGQGKADTLGVLRQRYTVTYEYEDAVYFRPSSRDDLLAPVEYMGEDVVVSMELMCIRSHRKAQNRLTLNLSPEAKMPNLVTSDC